MANNRVSFHIGIHTYDPTVYKEAPDLTSARDDAREMYNLAGTLGYTTLDLAPWQAWDGISKAPSNVLIDDAAKYEPVVALFKQAAALLKGEGDKCLITFSGHGTQLEKDPPVDDDDPEGKFHEAACLFDFPLVDDVIVGLLSGFKKGVEVFVVLDCCHSGATSNKVGDMLLDDILLAPLLSAAKPRSPYGIPKVATKPFVPPPLLPSQLLAAFKGFDRALLTANVAIFEACGDTESTFDGKKPGDLSVYTKKFIDAVGDGSVSALAVSTAIEAAKPKIDNCHPRFQHTPDETFLGKAMNA
jgi:hypothetical protein